MVFDQRALADALPIRRAYRDLEKLQEARLLTVLNVHISGLAAGNRLPCHRRAGLLKDERPMEKRKPNPALILIAVSQSVNWQSFTGAPVVLQRNRGRNGCHWLLVSQ